MNTLATTASPQRMNNPVMVLPEAMKALAELAKSTDDAGVSPNMLDLLHLRASQINGCSFCVDMHARDLKKAGERDERLYAVAAWRESPHFTDAERAVFLRSLRLRQESPIGPTAFRMRFGRKLSSILTNGRLRH